MYNLEMHAADVNNAFTKLFLKEDIYIKALPRVDVPVG